MERRTKRVSSARVLSISSAVALLVAVFVACWVMSMSRVFHDKAVNADALQRLWSYGTQVPLGVVVPAANRWTTRAFAAERSGGGPSRRIAVLILDDHYRGDDPTYRSKSGIIGDDVSTALLCSVPAQAARKGVHIDPLVSDMIRTRCPNVR